ncbi:MAG: hypothetical protein AAGJ68_06750 [Pseudomonadota bacterium]
MKLKFKWSLAAIASMMIAGQGAADTLLTFKVNPVAETQQPAILCVGDARDPARFGGMVTDQTGMAGVLVPDQTEDGAYVHTVTVTAFGPQGSATTQLDLAEMQVSGDDKRFQLSKKSRGGVIDLDLKPGEPANCGEARPISAKELSGKYERAMRAAKGDVLQTLEAQGSEITPQFLDLFINKTVTTIARNDAAELIQPTARRAALDEVLEQMAVAQRKREQTEKLKQFIEDFAAAARAMGKERDAAMEEARLERERQEMAERAKAEEERKAKLETCYGAMGPGCGIWAGEGLDKITLCGPSPLKSIIDGRYQLSCAINSGSWGHDECCTDDENGHWCFGPGPATASCTAEFDRGFARMLSPFQWERHDVDPTRTNGTGIVEHDLYCAKPGTPMWSSEVGYCCTLSGRQFNWVDGIAFTAQHGLWAAAIPDARICK